MIYPTKNTEIRGWDSQGNGAFGARRGFKLHPGEDLVVVPGQEIYAPFDGVIDREVQAYDDTPEYKGVEIKSDLYITKILYMDPDPDLIGKKVIEGQLIGHAQDISKKYQGITVHVHWEVYIRPSSLLG